jgi:spore coat protein U-like protein
VLYTNKAPVFDNKEGGRFFVLNGVEQLTGNLKQHQPTEVVDMKSLKLAVLAISLVGILGVGNVMAASSFDVTVNASVSDSCKVITSGVLDFPALDPINDGATTAAAVTTAPVIACTNSASFTLAADATEAFLLDDGAGNTFAYSMTVPPATFTGTGLNQTITGFGASVNLTDYEMMPAGSYSDVVTIDITFL